ncbi:MAG: DUF401 family protein [Nitrospirae bacterium]|nr:DUF401 family protein [Nitrospirota bacterium]
MTDLFRIILTFILILLLLRKKLHLGYVMLIASAVLFFLYRMDIRWISRTVGKAVANEVTLKLLLALSLIRIFELILREKEVLSRMMSAAKGFFRSRRAVIISMPMLIGMLPSLGGAYFSAPMVKEATTGLKMSQEEKAFINYWFRHPWEYILPLYPGILLASAVSNMPLYTIIAANLPYALVLLLTGFFYSMRGVSRKNIPAASGQRDALTKGLKSFLPVLAVLLLVVALRIELHYALLAVILPLILMYRYRLKDILRITRHGFALDVIVMIFGIMLFKEAMEASGAVKNLSGFFLEEGVPLLPIVCLLPFLTGLLTGLTVGFVGSTFPLLISVTGGASIAMISLAFASGFIGVLLSPVHLCLVLTKEYFRADLWGIYRKIVPSSLVIFISACVEYILLR